MTRYLIDQIAFLMVGVAFLLYILFHYHLGVMTLLVCVAVLFAWGFFCWRTLLLPLDLLLKPLTETLMFCSTATIWEGILLRKSYSPEWKFISKSGSKLFLLFPVSLSLNEIKDMQTPRNNQAVEVTYYRLSKIIIDWK